MKQRPPRSKERFKSVDSKFKRKRDELQKIMDQSLDVICTIDEEGKFLRVSKASQKVWGYDEGEIIGKRYINFVLEEDREMTLETENIIKEGTDVTNFENRYRRKDNSIVPILWSARWDPEEKIFYAIAKDASEKKEAEKKIKEGEEKFRSAIERVSDAFIALDQNWNLIYMNKRAGEIFNRDPKTIMGKNIWGFPDIKQFFYEIFNQAMDEQKYIHLEQYFSSFDTWFRLSIYPSPEGLSIFLVDVTGSKRQKEISILEKETLQLFASQTVSLEDIMKFLLDGVQKIHPEMMCSVLRLKGDRMYNWYSSQLPKGYNEEVEGLPIGIGKGSCGSAAYLREKVGVADISTHPYWREYKDIALPYGLGACWSYPLFNSDRSLLGTFAVYFNKPHILKKSEESTIERVIIILTNIIESKLAENSLKAYKNQLELIYNTSSDVIFFIAIEYGGRYRFVTVNQAFLTVTGLKKNQVEGKYVEEVIPEPSRSFVILKYQEVIRERKIVSWEETTNYPLGTKTGIVIVHPVFNEKKECTNLLGIIHDITERKKYENEIENSNQKLKHKNEELKRINSDLDNFIYTASHDLKAPISNIEGLMDALKESAGEEIRQNPEFKSIVELIYQSIDKFKMTIHDLTDISRVQRKIEEAIEKIDVCSEIDNVKEGIRDEIISSNAIINIDVSHCPIIKFPKKNFRSIMQNLLINAIKYKSPERDPIIEIKTWKEEGFDVLQIKDNGLGISEEDQKNIFGMFKRFHHHVEGTGIGLYIVKRIIENYYGKIKVESELGKGSAFRVYFKHIHQD